MSHAMCTQCDQMEDTDYTEGEWVRDGYICQTCVESLDEDELEDIKDRGR